MINQKFDKLKVNIYAVSSTPALFSNSECIVSFSFCKIILFVNLIKNMLNLYFVLFLFQALPKSIFQALLKDQGVKEFSYNTIFLEV